MRGDRLRSLRNKQGYTQEELSVLVNIGSRQIWRYENGETSPDGDTLGSIAKVLSTSADYLLGLTDDPTPNNEVLVQLSSTERAIIAALRRGEKYEAIKTIVEN
jgi:transcriptional regulator with XRE-family HTH domain